MRWLPWAAGAAILGLVYASSSKTSTAALPPRPRELADRASGLLIRAASEPRTVDPNELDRVAAELEVFERPPYPRLPPMITQSMRLRSEARRLRERRSLVIPIARLLQAGVRGLPPEASSTGPGGWLSPEGASVVAFESTRTLPEGLEGILTLRQRDDTSTIIDPPIPIILPNTLVA